MNSTRRHGSSSYLLRSRSHTSSAGCSYVHLAPEVKLQYFSIIVTTLLRWKNTGSVNYRGFKYIQYLCKIISYSDLTPYRYSQRYHNNRITLYQENTMWAEGRLICRRGNANFASCKSRRASGGSAPAWTSSGGWRTRRRRRWL